MTDAPLIVHAGRWRSLRTAIVLTWLAGGWRALAAMAFSCSGSLVMIASTLWIKYLIDAAIRQDRAEAIVAAVLVGGLAVIVGMAASVIGLTLRLGLEERVAIYLDARLVELTTSVATLEHHERAEYLDEMELLRAYRGSLASAGAALVENAASLVRFLSTVGILASIHPVLLLLPLFGLPSLLAAGKGQVLFQKAQEDTVANVRLAQHLFTLGTAAESGKELRVFGLAPEVIRRFRAEWDHTDSRQAEATVKGTVWVASGWAVFGLGYVLTIAFVTNEAVRGRATPGEVVLALSLASQVNMTVQSMANMVAWLLQNLKAVGRYLWLVDYAAASARRHDDPAPPPEVMRDGIRFHDVTFRYPGTEVDVLRHVDLHLPAGSTVAVVGDNGAGKSTLVKLLCRFYEPTGGPHHRRWRRPQPHRRRRVARTALRRLPGLRPLRIRGPRERRARRPRSHRRSTPR